MYLDTKELRILGSFASKEFLKDYESPQELKTVGNKVMTI